MQVHNSLRSPAPRAFATLKPAPAPRLLILPRPLGSCLACLSISIELLPCPRRDCRLLCSGGVALGPVGQGRSLGMWGGFWSRIRPATIVILLPTPAGVLAVHTAILA